MQLSEEQLALQEITRQIVKKYDRAYWLGCAKEGRYPDELWAAMADGGLLAVTVPSELGGLGLGLCELAVVGEELARAGVTMSSWQHTNWARTSIILYGSEEQKETIVKPTAVGQLRISLAVTEPDAGTNTFNIRSFAERQGDGFRLNGQKIFIGGADVSDYYLVVTRTERYTDNADKRVGLSLFLVSSSAPGVSVEPIDIVFPDVIRRFIIHFDDVDLSASALVGEAGQAARYMFSNLNTERVIVSAQALGLGYYVLEKGIAYAKSRVVFKGPIGQYQAVQHPFARARAQLDAARLMTYQAAEDYDAGRPAGDSANMAKFLTSEAAILAADATVQVHGGYAFATDYDVWNLYGQIRLFGNAPINNPMVLNYIAEHMLGLPRSY